MARAATTIELTGLRSENQFSKLYLAIHSPATVFAARVNQAFTADDSHDEIAQVTYDGVTTGAYTDIVVGQTVYVGSAAGLYDKGQCRVRKTPTDAILYVGEGSEIDWADDDYITVVDEFSIWPRHLKISSAGVITMDYDLAYSDQNANRAPIPVLGPDTALFILDDTNDEKITNGTFTTDATGWTAGGGATLTVGSGQLTIDQNSAGDEADHCSQQVYVNYREVYTLSVDVVSASDTFEIVIDHSTFEETLIDSGSGTLTADFTARIGNPTLILRATGATDATLVVDNVSIKAKGAVAFDPDASNSWVPGGTIDAYAWTAASSSSLVDDTTASPTITYDAAGTYRVSCEITSSFSTTATGYRNVFVYTAASMPATQFQVGDISGDRETGGWSFRVTLFDEALRSEIRDRAQVMIFANDWYGGVNSSFSPYAGGYNRVIAVGWIAGETISASSEVNTVEFDVRGPNYWIGRIPAFPAGIEDTDFANNGGGAPNRWTEMEDMTVDKALWFLVYWRTSAWMCMDVYPTSDTRGIAVVAAGQGTLWQQLQAFLDQTILAWPVCDRCGRMFTEKYSQFLAVADRSSIPTVMAITSTDVIDPITIERQPVSSTAMLEASGTVWSNGEVTAVGGRSPGDVFARFGDVDRSYSSLAFVSQADAITQAGLLAGWKNNEYPSIGFAFAQNNRLIDIAPNQYLTLTIATANTERGISFTDKKLIPQTISLIYDENGIATVDVDAEGYTTPWPAVKMVFPKSDGGPDIGGGDDEPPVPPVVVDEDPTGSDTDYVCATSTEVRTTGTFDEATPSWTDKTGAISGEVIDFCKVSDTVALALTSGVVYKTIDLDEAAPTWAASYTSATDWDTELGTAAELLRIAEDDGTYFVLAYSGQDDGTSAVAYLIKSHSGGDTWTVHEIYTQADAYDSFLMVGPYPHTFTTSGGAIEQAATVVRYDAEDDINPWGVLVYTANLRNTLDDDVKISIGGPAAPSVAGLFAATAGASSQYGGPDIAYRLFYEDSLNGTQQDLIDAFVTAKVGSNWDTGSANMPKDDARVEVWMDHKIDIALPYTAQFWVVWKKKTLNTPKALAVEENIFVGLTDKIVISRDGGYTWEDYVTDHGAHDIHIPAFENDDNRDIIYWSTAGGLHWAKNWTPGSTADYGLAALSETAQNIPHRIQSDPDAGFPVFALDYVSTTDWNVYKVTGGGASYTGSLLVTGVVGGRSLRMYKSGATRTLLYLDASDIHVSADDGATWTDDKKGDWAGYALPVKIEAITA